MDGASGRIVQVNISPGGVPKLPVDRAFVGPLGLAGDGHNDTKHHGGPDRAVCIFGMELIRRLQAEGHPITAGSTGENLTIEGLDFARLRPGQRLEVGETVVLEITGFTTPCDTIAASFTGGDFTRVAPALHPGDSRVYARVLREGVVVTGDPVLVLGEVPAEPS